MACYIEINIIVRLIETEKLTNDTVPYEPRHEKTGFAAVNSTISLLPKSEISSFQPSSVLVQLGLCQTWLKTPKTGFLALRHISHPLNTVKLNSISSPT